MNKHKIREARKQGKARRAQKDRELFEERRRRYIEETETNTLSSIVTLAMLPRIKGGNRETETDDGI